ncbi:VanW family protein [Clostridium chauvoei]|uniref:VanW family protein n=1 Tax=Clostridium chauvoei TaxID=46867 RepID=UPI001C856988|nr:VanW family protein [Clostridium chauvoei]MBX7368072.1 VanW family protein [Clostridium chauvoei]
MDSNESNTNLGENIVLTEETNMSLLKKLFKSKYFLLAIAIIVILVALLTYKGVKENNLIKSFSDKVYPGAYILDKDISGQTADELHKTLVSMMTVGGDKEINVTVGDQSFQTFYKNLDVTIPYEELEQDILNYGKDKNFFQKVKLLKKPENRTYKLELSYNEDKLNEFVNNISSTVNVAPVNASISIDGGINITAGQNGSKLNSETLLEQLKSNIKDIDSANVIALTGEMQTVEPTIKSEALTGVNKRIATFSTHYPGGPSGTNLEIAARNIDNSLVMPGNIFSCEAAIGPTTPENGFVLANTYVAGKVVKNYGGGVCQVASTLYNAMLRSGIIPTERMNHMMTVSYVPMGLDATLADGSIDLKFKNDFEFPVVINSYAGNGNLTIEFWSNDTVTKGITYEPKSYQKGPLSADTYLYGYDASGNQVYEKYLDTSTYQPFN